MKSNSGFYISRIKQINTRLLNKLLAQKNITAFNGEQGRILHVLWENDRISNQELSKRSGLAMSSLTTMLERMEEKNLLTRKGCPKDKRKCLLFLTDYANSLKKSFNVSCKSSFNFSYIVIAVFISLTDFNILSFIFVSFSPKILLILAIY